VNQRAIIPLSALMVAGTITFADLNKTGEPPTMRQWVGLSAVYMTLSFGSDLGFQPANGFAGLLMVGVFLSRGQEAFGYLGTKTGPKRKPKKQRRQKQPQQVEQVPQVEARLT
jgi:hypothetical protein